MDIFSSSPSSLENLPASLYGRVMLQDGILNASSELKGNLDLDALVARIRRRGGSLNVTWCSPKEFDETFSDQLNGNKVRGKNDIQSYAIDLIKKAHEQKASDIHITRTGKYTLVDLRCMGMVRDFTQLNDEDGKQLIQSIYQSEMSQAESYFSPFERQDGRVVDRSYLPDGVFSVRLHTEPIQSSLSSDGRGTFMAMRLLYDSTDAHGTLEERTGSLGFSTEQQEILRSLTERSGLTIISGPTGHGKSTVLRHCMESMVETMPQRNHVSFEDPPEVPMRGVKQVLVYTKNFLSELDRANAYNEAIAGAMRMDPDTIMLGEIRYVEAARASITAALTGHGVWTTLHASNALGIVPRLMEMGVSLQSLCNPNVLSGLVYQRLLPVLCSHCRVNLLENRDAVSPYVFDRLTRVIDDLGDVHVRGQGCEHCSTGHGLVSQTVAAEVIPMNQRLLKLLRNDDIAEAHRYWVRDMKGKTHVAQALRLVESGQVDPSLAEERLGVPLDFDQMEAA